MIQGARDGWIDATDPSIDPVMASNDPVRPWVRPWVPPGYCPWTDRHHHTSWGPYSGPCFIPPGTLYLGPPTLYMDPVISLLDPVYGPCRAREPYLGQYRAI